MAHQLSIGTQGTAPDGVLALAHLDTWNLKVGTKNVARREKVQMERIVDSKRPRASSATQCWQPSA